MVRWRQVEHSAANVETVKQTYRPNIYRRALKDTDVALPGASSKVEGALAEPTFMPAKGGRLSMGPDGFFDRVKFDPDAIEEYIRTATSAAALHKN
jgi:two-component system, oxyanion-binding sensor